MPFTTPAQASAEIRSDSPLPVGDTQPVFIQSSPQRMGQGPARRVLRRGNKVFVSLRTPESPTVVYLAEKRRRELGQAIKKSGSRRTNDFVELPSRFPNSKSKHDWLSTALAVVPIIEPLDLAILSGSSWPASGQTVQVTKGTDLKGLNIFITNIMIE